MFEDGRFGKYDQMSTNSNTMNINYYCYYHLSQKRVTNLRTKTYLFVSHMASIMKKK